MRKIFAPILFVAALAAIVGTTGSCTSCTGGGDTVSGNEFTDSLDTTLLSTENKPVTLTGIAADGARRSIEFQPLGQDTLMHFDYPTELSEEARTCWVVGDTIAITYIRGTVNGEEADSVINIVKVGKE